MMKSKNKSGFTFIEILVVVTIIGLLSAVAIASYSSFLKQSRDSKRKADLEQVRAALEMYRSNTDTGYPVGATYSTTLSILTSGTVYLQSLPTDPKSPTYAYYYNGTTSNYTLGAYLESGGVSCQAGQCGGFCNYCLGPYGQK